MLICCHRKEATQAVRRKEEGTTLKRLTAIYWQAVCVILALGALALASGAEVTWP